MRHFLLGFIVLLLHSSTYGQHETTLQGYLGIEGGETFKYKLVFSDSAQLIKGYSYTWQDEAKMVKAAIVGTINNQEKSISFQETKIVSNSGFESTATICLIKAKLTLKDDVGAITLSGAITSSDINQVACAAGSISIPFTNDVEVVFKNYTPQQVVEAKETVITKQPTRKLLKIIYDTVVKEDETKILPPKIEQITEGKDKLYHWKSNDLVLDIWDGGKTDGDLVSIEANGETILKNYDLINTKKRIQIPLHQKGMTIIKIIARNEGNEPPNTANLLLWDGSEHYELIAYNNIAGVALIKIIKE